MDNDDHGRYRHWRSATVSRCGVIYPNGATELLPANPATHRRLRGLGYTRFLLKLEREVDHASFSAPVYASSQPSRAQLMDIAAQLWESSAEMIRVFDEDGELLEME
jgi:hypothetical protein